VPLAGLDAAAITKKLEQAIAIGEQMPRDAYQSHVSGKLMPLIVD
jgi:hypothetical protein